MLLPLAASPNLKVIAIAEDNTHIGHRLGGIETELTWKPLPRGRVLVSNDAMQAAKREKKLLVLPSYNIYVDNYQCGKISPKV